MRIAFIIFDQITLLDFIGVYDPISRLKTMNYLPDLEWDVCSFTESASDSFGLAIIPHKIQPSLSEYDAIIIPGGIGTRQLQYDDPFLHWIQRAQSATYKI